MLRGYVLEGKDLAVVGKEIGLSYAGVTGRLDRIQSRFGLSYETHLEMRKKLLLYLGMAT